MSDFEINGSSEQKQKTIVIFGASSFVGSNLAEFFKKDYKVIGTYHKTKISIEGVLCLPCDVLSKDEVQMIIYAFRPDMAVYCVGLTSVYDCSLAPQVAEALNTSGLFNVAEAAQRYKCQTAYISSSLVFPGENKGYLEADMPDANTTYGKTKSSAEFFLQKNSLNYIIFRTCTLYGRSINPRQYTWFEDLQRKMNLGTVYPCDNSVVNGFLDVEYLGLAIKICFEKGITNRLFQLSSTDTMTIYDFALLYAEIFGESPASFSKAKWNFPMIKSSSSSETPQNNTFYKMETGNIESFLNIKLPSIRESLEYTYKKLFMGRRGPAVKKKSTAGINFI